MIKALRQRRGLSRAALARRLNISPLRLYRYEHGVSPIPTWLKGALAQAFQADKRTMLPKWFVGYAPDGDALRKFVIHMHEPGFIHDGTRVVCWLDTPKHKTKNTIRLLLMKAKVMANSERW